MLTGSGSGWSGISRSRFLLEGRLGVWEGERLRGLEFGTLRRLDASCFEVRGVDKL